MLNSPRRRTSAAIAAIVGILVVATTGWLTVGLWNPARPTPSPAASALVAGASGTAGVTATPSPSETPTEQPSPTPSATPSPTPGPAAATTDGVILSASQAATATRHPIAVMIDDQADARPQSGLSQADIVYQAPAEGGIPRYMAIFQTQDPASIGPIRSARLYFVGWAAEWSALYAHVGGAPNALAYLQELQGKRSWDADEYQWGGAAGYMFRIAARWAPHNCYTTTAKIRSLAARVGATAPFTAAPWTFQDAAPAAARPARGTLVVPYPENRVSYAYDAASNTYLRSVSGEGREIDAGNGRRVAPSNVVVQYVHVGPLLNSGPGSTNEKSGRLEIDYVSSGTATVFENGVSIAATWSKAGDLAPTLYAYASGPNAGQPIPFVRGQIFVQIVPVGTAVSWAA